MWLAIKARGWSGRASFPPASPAVAITAFTINDQTCIGQTINLGGVVGSGPAPGVLRDYQGLQHDGHLSWPYARHRPRAFLSQLDPTLPGGILRRGLCA